MTIKTLMHIRRLLEDDLNRADDALEFMRKAVREAEKDEASNPERLKFLGEQKFRLWAEYDAVKDAYREFMEHDFR